MHWCALVCAFLPLFSLTLTQESEKKNDLKCGTSALEIQTTKGLASFNFMVTNNQTFEALNITECVQNCCGVTNCNVAVIRNSTCHNVSLEQFFQSLNHI